MRYFVILSLLGFTSLLQAGNIVRNGNFENGKISPWKCAQQRAGKKTLHSISKNTRFGKYCLKLCGDLQNKRNRYIILAQDLPILDKKQEYILSFQVRSSLENKKNKKFQVHIRQIGKKSPSLGYERFNVNLNDDLWCYREIRFKPHPKAIRFAIHLINSNFNSGDAVYIDEIRISPASSPGKAFNPNIVAKSANLEKMEQGNTHASIDKKTGLLSSLVINQEIIHPLAKNSCVIFVQQNDKEYQLDGKNTTVKTLPFKAKVDYKFINGMFRETVIIEAIKDQKGPFKLGVRHGIDQNQWNKSINALSPLRVLPAAASTIYSFRSDVNDLNLTMLELYQGCVYPMLTLENDKYYLLAGSCNVDDFVTLSPNHPKGFIPSLQRNPRGVKKGDTFRFETNWKLFSRDKFMLRDVWRFYTDNLYSKVPELKKFIPPRYTQPRTFYSGPFGSMTAFSDSREKRLFPESCIWYPWHDHINERYPVSGTWWSYANGWKKKLSAKIVKQNVEKLKAMGLKPIMYLRQLANLKLRGTKYPDSWYKKTPGGSLHLYAGGYQRKLPANVAKEVHYNAIPWGSFDFSNSEYRNFYLDEIFKVMKFYQPPAIGWDMGRDIYEFLTLAETYERIQKEGMKIKTVGNEGVGPGLPYLDMALIENGLLGGKSHYDFEISRCYNTALVCLERYNLFRAAVESNLHGKRTWLYERGLKANKRYLDVLLKKHPELKKNIIEAARLCQLRACLYDLSLGASPGYLEETKPVPAHLVKMAGDVNGILKVNHSFALKFPNNYDSDGPLSASAWANKNKFRLVIFNDCAKESLVILNINKRKLSKYGWNFSPKYSCKSYLITPRQERTVSINLKDIGENVKLATKLPAFTALMVFVNSN
jgi:hypothetical protein